MLVRLQECGGSQLCPHNRRKSTCKVGAPPLQLLDDRAVYCSCQKQTSYTFRGYVLKRDVTKFQGYTLLAV